MTKTIEVRPAGASLAPETTKEPKAAASSGAAAAEPAAKPAKKAKAKKGGRKPKAAGGAGANMTLAELGEAYVRHLDAEGKSPGTVASYGMEMKTACAVIGADVKLRDLTPALVQDFYDSAPVTRLRNGKEKAKPSIDKTRRVLRLALWYAEEAGLIEKAPLPEPPAKG